MRKLLLPLVGAALVSTAALAMSHAAATATSSPTTVRSTIGSMAAADRVGLKCAHRRVCRPGQGCAWRKVCKRW
jgi:hypothetical protein